MKITIKREQRQMDLSLSSVSNLRGAKTRFLSILAISALLFSSCNSDNEELADNWDGEIRLTTVSTSPQTKAAPNDQIASGQKVGLYLSEDAAVPTATYTPNVLYTADGTGGLAGAVQYYPATGNAVKLGGYHPHNAGAADTYDFSVAANQSTNSDYYNSDLLYSAQASYVRQKAAHTLVFSHRLSKITYTLVEGVGTPTVAGATVKILNTLPTASFDRTAGTVGVAKGAAASITPNAGGAVVVPQTIAAGTKLIEVTLASGGTLYHTVPAGDIVFESGKVYNFTITANLTTISLTTTVTNWTPVGKDVTAEME